MGRSVPTFVLYGTYISHKVFPIHLHSAGIRFEGPQAYGSGQSPTKAAANYAGYPPQNSRSMVSHNRLSRSRYALGSLLLGIFWIPQGR